MSAFDGFNRDNLWSLIPSRIELLQGLQVNDVLIGFPNAHVHLWVHVEGEVGVDEDHEALEPVLACYRNLVNLCLRHVVELNLIPDEESDIKQTLYSCSEVNWHLNLLARAKKLIVATDDLLDSEIEDDWVTTEDIYVLD